MGTGNNKEAVKMHIAEIARELGYDTSETIFNLTLSDILLEGIIEVLGDELLNISEAEIEKMIISGVKATSKIEWKKTVRKAIAENQRIKAA